MHLIAGTIHVSREEILGLIRTAQEITPLCDTDIPDNVSLEVEASQCRTAAYRLTNCTGVYNSGHTVDGREPRWAFASGGSWHLYSSEGPRGTSRTRAEAETWIAAAPYRPVDEPVPTVAPARPGRPVAPTDAGRYIGPIRSPQAYYRGVPGGYWFHALSAARDGGQVSFTERARIAYRTGRRWYMVEFIDGIRYPRGYSGRRRAIRWVDSSTAW